jgi:peroxiredoxin
VRQLAQLYPQIQKEFATEVLIIGGGSLKEATNLVKTYDLLFPVATDPEHKVYISYNLNRIASFYQRSGVFILDKQGKVRYAQRAILPSGGLDVPEVMKALYSFPTFA